MEEKSHEYLLVIEPKGRANQKADEVKCIFGQEYGCAMATNRPHITLSNFVLVGRLMEARILEYFNRFFTSRNPFELEIDGFDHFENHTIFLKVSTKETIVKIVKDIRKKFRRHLTPHKSFPPIFSMIPHLTIARKMHEDQFQKAWPVWHNHEFNANFNVDEVLLIKRQYPTINKYQVVERFKLKGLGEDGEQLRLPL